MDPQPLTSFSEALNQSFSCPGKSVLRSNVRRGSVPSLFFCCTTTGAAGAGCRPECPTVVCWCVRLVMPTRLFTHRLGCALLWPAVYICGRRASSARCNRRIVGCRAVIQARCAHLLVTPSWIRMVSISEFCVAHRTSRACKEVGSGRV